MEMFCGHLDTKLGALVEKFKVLDVKQQLQSPSRAERFERLDVKKEISLVWKWVDNFWRQRAKQHWNFGADQNTKFFHRVANNRRKFNTIHSICVDVVSFNDNPSVKSVPIPTISFSMRIQGDRSSKSSCMILFRMMMLVIS